MRTNHLFLLGAIGLGMLAISCGPSAAEKRLDHIQDSLRMADSIAKAEAEAAALAEQARLDSIRQDSIAKAEKMKDSSGISIKDFVKKENMGNECGTYTTSLGDNKIIKNLKRAGFIVNDVKKRMVWDDASDSEYQEVTTTLSKSLTSGKLRVVLANNGFTITITFPAGHADLNEFIEGCKQFGYIRTKDPNYYIDMVRCSYAGMAVDVNYKTSSVKIEYVGAE